MDWAKQTQEMMKSWTETQANMWDSWLNSLGGDGKSKETDAWQKTIETWQKSVNDTLAAQLKLMQMWVDNLNSAKGNLDQVTEWVNQAEEMTRRMNDAQKELWDNCFKTLKKADLGTTPASWEQEGQKIFQAWQESARQAMDTQAKWASKWMKK
ncbi:MAG: hypothetical protein ACE5NW_12390 [Acidiferrobacterales bacterium]